MFRKYDVIVVGGGHAGAEAAAAAANLGSKTLLITQHLDTISQMSCNPAIGGVAKGQIVREIDALGGYTGIITDKTMIQFRMLNRSKGPAMWSPRAQSDRMLFSAEWRLMLENTANLDLWQDEVCGLLFENNKVTGVKTKMQLDIQAHSVILTNGTFLNGIIHIGEFSFPGGRIGEPNVQNLTQSIVDMGFETARLKTGTPMRVDGRSIDFSVLEEQKGDKNPQKFSFTDTPKLTYQRSCHLAYTNLEVHDVLREGFEKSPMFTGRIQGRGPRYCPSIEDKIDRFADKTRHQLFIEPEGWQTNSYYINGFSSSLPMEVQYAALQKVKGFEKANILRPGYAIEYDYFPPTQLKPTLETKQIQNLYFAGQINGTTGYEEAAAQGLMAGINAHLKRNEKQEFILGRSQAYIGVLIDDLVTKGVDEPYRMFTSRAEYRILLRQDNADVRLTPLSHAIGLASDERMQKMEARKSSYESIIQYLNENSVAPEEINPLLEICKTPPILQRTKLVNILLRPQVNIQNLLEASGEFREFILSLPDLGLEENLESAEILLKYKRYIEKEQEITDKLSKFENIPLRENFNYHALNALSYEAREKLSRIRPHTIGQASRISGVSPADISVLIVFLGR